jgi:alkanesulfonate monooxygenase SsuD/methylene tetrahydromethanopterin reductase-like flavin-dependent oxidoreductase (luciferase family)
MSGGTSLDAQGLSVGYLLPTRDAVTLGRPAALPLLALGVRAEALGFDAVWAGDGPLARPRHDALSMLAALAASTERIVLGTAVLIAALRSALLLAQAAATIDQIAQGRLLLGVGAGFPFPETERQFEAVGVPYAGRVGRMTETIAAMRALWATPGEPVSYRGRHLALREVELAPSPHRSGGPPIWLAGLGTVAERRVGEMADGWLPYPPNASLYGEAWKRVRAASHRAGRERPPLPGLYATIAIDRRTENARRRLRRNIERYYAQPLELIEMLQATYAGTADGLGEWLTDYVRAGARHIVLRVCDENAERGLEAAGEARAMAIAELADTMKETAQQEAVAL